MANTYEYKISDMQRDADGIVVAVSFTVTASDGTDSFTHNYQTALNAPSGNPIDFEDLEESEVIDWVKELVQSSVEEQADAELEAFKQRKEITSGVPWETA
jgi:hypothetical protein